MRWPWKRHKPSDLLVVSWAGQTLTFVRARRRQDGLFEVLQAGSEYQGQDGEDAFVDRLHGLGLKGHEVHAMLRPEQYQIFQVDAPAVAPEEVRAAVRWQIRDMVDLHVDDLTLDVMRVGGGRVGLPGQLFVVVAANKVLAEVLHLGEAMEWNVSVVDIQETAQRNLLTAAVERDGRVERANAALMLVNPRQVLLTISVNAELYYSRRIDLGAGFTDQGWGGSVTPATDAGPGAPGPELLQYVSGDVVARGEDAAAQRFVVEVQRSLDVWERNWSDLPLDGLWVEAGVHSAAMAGWLSRQLGFIVKPLQFEDLFPGLEGLAEPNRTQCLPLLGILLRTEERKL